MYEYSKISIYQIMHIEKTKVFAALSNQIRLRCIYLLATHEEICVCDFVDTLEISQPAASKALSNLKSVGLISDRREANWVYYRLNAELPGWLVKILDGLVIGLTDDKVFVADKKRCNRLVARPRQLTCA